MTGSSSSSRSTKSRTNAIVVLENWSREFTHHD